MLHYFFGVSLAIPFFYDIVAYMFIFIVQYSCNRILTIDIQKIREIYSKGFVVYRGKGVIGNAVRDCEKYVLER